MSYQEMGEEERPVPLFSDEHVSYEITLKTPILGGEFKGHYQVNPKYCDLDDSHTLENYLYAIQSDMRATEYEDAWDWCSEFGVECTKEQFLLFELCKKSEAELREYLGGPLMNDFLNLEE